MTLIETKTLYIPNDVTLGVPPTLVGYVPTTIDSIKMGILTFDKFEYLPTGVPAIKINNIYCKDDK